MRLHYGNNSAAHHDIPRRVFLQRTGMSVLGVAAFPYLRNASAPPGSASTAKLGMQLYTVRDAIKADMAGTLRRVAALGFEGVETAFWPDGVSLAKAATALNDAGLSVSSCHIELPLGDKRQVMLDTAAAFRCKTMIWHGWPEDPRYSSLDGTKALARIYNDANRIAKDNGLRFGLHNHWWEFRNKVGGRYAFEVLLDEVDPDIFFEVDTYWVKVAGHRPADIVQRLGRRAPLLHIKDGPAVFHESLAADNPDPMTSVGKGTQDFPSIVRAANGNTEWMIVEMDRTVGDVFQALSESVEYLVSNRLVRGKQSNVRS